MKKTAPQKKTKIVFLLPNLDGGGAERVCLTLLQNLNTDNFSVTLVLLNKQGVFSEDIDAGKYSIIDMQCKNRILGLLKVPFVLKKEEPDIFFTSIGPYNAILALLLGKNTPYSIVARETNIPSFIHSMKIQQKKYHYLFIKAAYKLFYNNYDAIVAQSIDMKQDLEENYAIKTGKISVINNPVDTEKINRLVKDVPNPFTDTHLSGKLILVSAGRLTYQKGIDLLLNQLSECREIPYHLFIIGSGPESNTLQKQLSDLKIEEAVTFLGFRKDVHVYMKHADLFCLPSRTEGFPNVVLESFASGTPVIANDCKGGINELIIPGMNGKIIDFNEPGSLNRTLKSLSGKTKDSTRIMNDVKRRFGKEKIVTEYERFLEGLKEDK